MSCTDLPVSSNEPRSFRLQLLLQTGGGSAACGVARKLQLQFPDFLLLPIALRALSVNTLLHLDQFGLDLLQFCTELEEVTEHKDDKRKPMRFILIFLPVRLHISCSLMVILIQSEVSW